MQPVKITFAEERDCHRNDYVVRQGIPVQPLTEDEANGLIITGEDGAPERASVSPEYIGPDGKVRWVQTVLAVDCEKGGKQSFYLQKSDGREIPGNKLTAKSYGTEICVESPLFKASFRNPGQITISTDKENVIDGDLDFELRSDARSAVGNQRPVYFEPEGFTLESATDKCAHITLSGRYRAWVPKNKDIDEKQRYDVHLDIYIFADSPAIRMSWTITDHMKFNCRYMWLDRYLIKLPLAGSFTATGGDYLPDENKYKSWAEVSTGGGNAAMAFPFHDWLGQGAGVEIGDDYIASGGVNPAPDGGFGGKFPDIHRKFFYGMSRTFECSLIVNGSYDQITSELRPLPVFCEPQHYSDTGALPENGQKVTFGPCRDKVERAADYLLDNQWKHTLWFGEWWREVDVDNNLGIEEVNSGNSSLGPLYHFYRTGDWRYFESAKMSYLYTWDIQFCKREDEDGPYMHTRRFLLDHQEWFHPRYQRVGAVMKISHLLCDKTKRDKMVWFLRYWGDNYVAEDGAPMTPTKDGGREKCEESAMSNFADSLMYAYMETHDAWFLEKAKLIGDWVVRGAQADMDNFCSNSNSTRYILRGLLQLCEVTNDPRYKETFVEIERWTANAPTFRHGTHYNAFHFYYAAVAYKYSGSREILEKTVEIAKWVLDFESKEMPGTYPFPQGNQYPTTNWICTYDNKAIVSYLPVLVSILEEAGYDFAHC